MADLNVRLTTDKHANSQASTRLSVAERTARLLAFKKPGYFNSPIAPSAAPGTSAAARAKAAI